MANQNHQSKNQKQNENNKGDLIMNKITENEGNAIFSEVRGSSEQRTKPHLGCGEGVVAGDNEEIRKNSTPEVVFFGNGLLSNSTLEILKEHFEIIFHAKTAGDLEKVAEIKASHPDAIGILASFGIIVKPEIFNLFEPVGILNIHPSLLPAYRGASPIETAILNGDKDFSYSIMKLVKKMDAGPIYHQETFKNLTIDKATIYRTLATAGATWISEHLDQILAGKIQPAPQDDSKATFTTKFDKSMSFLEPEKYTANELFRQIVAYQNFPKPKYNFFGKTCILLKAHTLRVTDILCEAAGITKTASPLMIKCKDRNFVVIDELQPEGKRPMDARSFVNGYGKKR